MPLNSYFKGHGNEVMSNMQKEYGDRGKNVFYALANKKGLKPAAVGDTASPYNDNEIGPMPNPTPPQGTSVLSPYDQAPIGSQGAVPAMGTPPGGMPSPQPQMASNVPVPSGPPMPIGGGAPIGPPPPTNTPVLNTGDMGHNPIYRAGMIAGMEKADESPGVGSMPTPFKSQIGQGPMAQAASKAGQAYADSLGKKTSGWKEVLGLALGALGGSRVSAISSKLTGDDQKAKLLQQASNLSTLSDEERKQQAGAESSEVNRQRIASEVENRRTQADIRATNAATRQESVRASQAHIDELKSAQVRKWVEDQIGKSRMEDAAYQKETDSKPPNWEFIKNPEKPGEGWAVPPSWSPLPTELAPHAPGYKVNDLTPHSVIKQATKDYNAANLAKTKVDEKVPPLEDRIINQHIKNTHPGESLSDARIHTAVKQPTEPVPPGTWTMVEDANGKPQLMNTKTGEVKDSGGIQRPGTKAKKDADEEKRIGPVRDAVKYADTYSTEEHPTGPKDEALMEKFFEVAKPSTGFRMTQNQMDMLKNGRSWLDAAKAHGTHGAYGEWFDAEQRKQIVDAMRSLGKAKGVGAAAPGNPNAPIGPTSTGSPADSFLVRHGIGR